MMIIYKSGKKPCILTTEKLKNKHIKTFKFLVNIQDPPFGLVT